METLRDLRLQAKKTCTEVAQALGVVCRAYQRYEQGTRRISLEQVIISFTKKMIERRRRL